MKISGFKTFRYQLPLKRELFVRGQTLRSREGIIVQIIDEAGNSGFGEVAPLAPVSLENLSQAAEQLNRLRKGMLDTLAPQDFMELEKRMKRNEDLLFPSVRFGVEAAFWALWAARRRVSPAEFLNPSAAAVVPVNGLLVGDSELSGQTADLLRQGFRTLKLKVGGNVEQDIVRTMTVLDLCRESAILRLDANQGWSFDDAVRFGETQGVTVIEYIEEPFADVERVPEFYERTLIPVAVDESLRRHDLAQLKAVDGVEVVILKPTVLGLKRTIDMAVQAREYGLRPVVSSSFESGLGIAMLAQLSAALCRNIPVGLDTQKYFADDLVIPVQAIERGAMTADFPSWEQCLRFDCLKEWS